jgi:hypothetical protein
LFKTAYVVADTCGVSEKSKNGTVRRIVLPSGRMIEVVEFAKSRPAHHELHVCPECRSDLVQPVAWSEAEHHRWELTLECPNCWWSADGTFEREQVHELEDQLDEGLAQLLNDLKRLSRANMAEEINRFVTALDADHILPEDF